MTIGSDRSLNVQLQERLSADSRSSVQHYTINIFNVVHTTTKLPKQNDERKYEFRDVVFLFETDNRIPFTGYRHAKRNTLISAIK